MVSGPGLIHSDRLAVRQQRHEAPLRTHGSIAYFQLSGSFWERCPQLVQAKLVLSRCAIALVHINPLIGLLHSQSTETPVSGALTLKLGRALLEPKKGASIFRAQAYCTYTVYFLA